MTNNKSTLGYEAAHEAAVYFPRADAGYLEIHGEDRVDFLQRQTTNDLRLLAPTRSINNVLTSATARVLETFQMLDGDEHIAMLIPSGRTESTVQFLKSHIFFMDKVEVHNHSAEWSQIELHGPQVSQRLEELGISPTPSLDEVLEIEVAGTPIRVAGLYGLTSELSYLMLVGKEDEDTLTKKLQNSGFLQLEQAGFQTLRVEAGLPALGHELTPDYTPLESGLAHWVSDSKGCYTGQEVIARQITYDKVTKSLVQLELQQMVELGAKVLADGKAAGTITSVAHSPRLGPIALAFLKRPHNAPGTAVRVAHEEKQVSGSVRTLGGVSQENLI